MTIVLDKPHYHPGVCIECGAQSGRRWFVDLQLRLDNAFNPANGGAVYLCDVCFDSLVLKVSEQVQEFIGLEDPVGFSNPEPLLEKITLKEEETSGSGISFENDAGTDHPATDNDQSTGNDNSGSDQNDSDEESDDLSGFRGFFGKP